MSLGISQMQHKLTFTNIANYCMSTRVCTAILSLFYHEEQLEKLLPTAGKF